MTADRESFPPTDGAFSPSDAPAVLAVPTHNLAGQPQLTVQLFHGSRTLLDEFALAIAAGPASPFLLVPDGPAQGAPTRMHALLCAADETWQAAAALVARRPQPPAPPNHNGRGPRRLEV